MRALYLVLFAGFVLLSGAPLPRAASTRTEPVACATASLRAHRATSLAAALPSAPRTAAAPEFVEGVPVDAPRAASRPRFLLHRALLN